MPDFGANLQRLMARDGLTIDQVVAQTGLDERTIRGILRGSIRRPHARTLHRLASGLGVPADELFQNAALLAQRQFDRQTNPLVDELTSRQPELFEGWLPDDFDELYSQFGAGGQLTAEGALQMVQGMNRRRELLRKAAVVAQSQDAALLEQLVDALYQRVVLTPPKKVSGTFSRASRNKKGS
jgi:transcriptional regulator with XRE-family HTH domain